jgi:hypothetical protein
LKIRAAEYMASYLRKLYSSRLIDIHPLLASWTYHDFTGVPLAIVFSVLAGPSQLVWLHCVSPQHPLSYFILTLAITWTVGSDSRGLISNLIQKLIWNKLLGRLSIIKIDLIKN